MFIHLFRKRRRVPAPDHVLAQLIRFGALGLHDSEAPQHFMAAGAPGSGKTTLLRLFLQSILWRVQPGSDVRVMLFDAKQDAYSLLRGICPDLPIFLLNPFDRRGVAWDVARDICEPRLALEAAHILIPKQAESQPFFSDASRDLLASVMISYLKRGLDWTLADLLRAVASPELLRRVLLACPETTLQVDRYFGDERLLHNVISALATHLQAFSALAAVWERAERRISLADWAAGESVLVLGASDVSRQALHAVNRCLFKCASNLILNQSESRTRRSFFLFDELAEAGRLDGLASLCKKGRSKGASVFLAFQSVAGLRDPNLYGPHQAAEILGQIGHRWFGRLECAETAQWASDLIGEQELSEETYSQTYAKEGSTTYQQHIVVRKTVLPSELLALPACSQRRGLTGIYISRATGVHHQVVRGPKLFGRLLIPHARDVEDFLPRSVDDQYLVPWTPEAEALFAPRADDGAAETTPTDGDAPPRPRRRRARNRTPTSHLFPELESGAAGEFSDLDGLKAWRREE